MSNFQLVRYKATDTWIPETDIDGVDAVESVLSNVLNVDFSNGYIENASKVIQTSFPSNVTTKISAGYVLISSKTFFHSTEGQQTVYILWKQSTSDLVIYRNNTLMVIDENNVGIAYLSKPEIISYNLVNDQLKINLNIQADYLTADPVILNLTLIYLPETIYRTAETQFSAINFVGTGVNNLTVGGTENNGIGKHYEIRIAGVAFGSPDVYWIEYSVDGIDAGEQHFITDTPTVIILSTGIQLTFADISGFVLNDAWTFLTAVESVLRPEGWYLCPRWLGWAQKDVTLNAGQTYVGEVTEDFEDSTYINGFDLGDTVYNRHKTWLTGTVPYYGKCMYCIPASSSSDFNIYVATFSNLRNVKKVEFMLSSEGAAYENNASFSVAVGDFDNNLYEVSGLDLVYYTNRVKVTVDVNSLKSQNFRMWFKGWIAYGGSTAKIIVDDIKIYASNVVVLAVYGDGQRALLKENLFGIWGTFGTSMQFSIKQDFIDWRVVKYEVYQENTDLGYVLIGDVAVDGTGWTVDGIYLEKNVRFLEETDTDYLTALTFKYNLANDSYVDNQRHIYSEIAHKGRVYFVNNDYKVYQSHISTNLAIQADAFPYDEETGFGYFIVDHSKLNLALANSPTNDMVIITNQGMYVYFIQPSGSGSFKQLRMGSGNITICALKSLTSLLNGEPASDGLFWIDYNGIYFYGGGLTAPENLITATHQRYWEALTTQQKDDAVGFYNPVRKEYWLYIDNRFLIFELSYKKFKRYGATHDTDRGSIEFVGYANLIPQYTDKSYMYVCSPGNRWEATLDTHYTTVEANPEIYHKILQELYLEFGTSDSGAIIYMTVYADDWTVGTYIFNSSNQFEKWLSPVGVRFNRLKIRLTLPANKHIKIKEFGFSYSPDISEPLAITPIDIASSGYGFNYGFNY